ncbi:hypothetical protein KAW38_02605 [Candidatus Micrarchaeota archaeon]|nr:hypothetical protein [Candidatus Micrarchaeota archaeon]
MLPIKPNFFLFDPKGRKINTELEYTPESLKNKMQKYSFAGMMEKSVAFCCASVHTDSDPKEKTLKIREELSPIIGMKAYSPPINNLGEIAPKKETLHFENKNLPGFMITAIDKRDKEIFKRMTENLR